MIGVVGGNLAGLAAAYGLHRRGHDVRVFESGEAIGGIAATTTAGGEPLERVPTTFARRDRAALELLAELDVAERLEWRAARTAMARAGTVHPVDAPWEFLADPALSLADTARLAALRSGLDLRGLPRRRPRTGAYDDPSAFADVPAERFLREHANGRVYERFYGPLLEARFGPHAPDASAAWILEELRRERDRLGRSVRGILEGSAAVLVDALREAIGDDALATNATVADLESGTDGVERIRVERAGRTERHDVDGLVVATPDAPGVDLRVPVRRRTCVRVSTTATEPLLESYRTTLVDGAPFDEVVAHTALAPADRYGGHQYYLLDGGRAHENGVSTEAVERRWLEAFADRFASFEHNALAGVETTRFVQPVPAADAARSPGPRTADGVHYAGVGTRATGTGRLAGGRIEAGLRCADRIGSAGDSHGERRRRSVRTGSR